MDGMPHIYQVDASLLPAGLIECGCCGERCGHRRIGAFDEDLASYLCWGCTGPMAQAEWTLIASRREGGRVRARRPEMMEALDLEEVELRELAGDGTADER